jgi:hypothetical protein
MMFTPCWPSAGPMGGAGLAALGLDLKLDQTCDLLLRCHDFSSLSCRPKAALPPQGASLQWWMLPVGNLSMLQLVG